MRYFFLIITLFLIGSASGQTGGPNTERSDSVKPKQVRKKPKIIYGIASYYHEKFNGRLTANGEIYDSKKLTAACNQLPLGTWIRVTNLNNNRSVIVKTNDRLHIRMKRVVDLSRAAAVKLGYIGQGLTKVKVEVLQNYTKDYTN